MKTSFNFPHGFFLVIAIIICLALLVTADINDARKTAIKNVETQVNNIKKLTEETSVEVENRKKNIQTITKHEREFGDEIFESTNFQISKTAKSAYMMANLLGSSNNVFRCIETREREGLEDTNKYYYQKFLEPGRDYESRALQYQSELIKNWKDEYYQNIDQYAKIYQKTVADIQKSTSESAISTLVKNFDQTTRQMADIITVIYPVLNRTHIQVLRTLDQLINNLQQYAKYRVEETSKAIQKCFPQFYQREFFFNHYLF